ncbi:MAG: hypothetical protein DI598_14190 [Pseudopedobacter saltans]|uniref:Uncharacterized protein n=1 Tax=Pseudopedobacter saltans TaxID=151895 RepID=A0A2W5GN87_9SPHI|nr:MAG: hypothetical protein DI598_14190 [Pseudopedobacter saltans]
MKKTSKIKSLLFVFFATSLQGFCQNPRMLRYTAPYVSSKPIIDAEINTSRIVKKQRDENAQAFASWIKYVGDLKITSKSNFYTRLIGFDSTRNWLSHAFTIGFDFYRVGDANQAIDVLKFFVQFQDLLEDNKLTLYINNNLSKMQERFPNSYSDKERYKQLKNAQNELLLSNGTVNTIDSIKDKYDIFIEN